MNLSAFGKCLIVSAGVAFAAPASVAQSFDGSMIYVDEELRPMPAPDLLIDTALDADRESGNFIAEDLSVAYDIYADSWGNLPQDKLREGATLKAGDRGSRVADLRQRLGLPEDTVFDDALARLVAKYRAAHSLPEGNMADDALIQSLNKGYDYYSSLIELNIERANELPRNLGERFMLVDTTSQQLYLYEGDTKVDTMRVIVGRKSDPTPAMAALVRYSVVNPYWNVPPDLVRRSIAPKVVAQGLPYLQRTGFEALSGWTIDADILDPTEVDWKAVAAGDFELRVRQRPGPGNGMGEIKFMLPNDAGIYLHDTPSRDLFERDVRALSSGCVRLEDAWRVARWLYGERLQPDTTAPEHAVMLDDTVPVYITYFTAMPNGSNIEFREDLYDRDTPALANRQDNLSRSAS